MKCSSPAIKFILGCIVPVICILFLLTNSIPTLNDYEKSKENRNLTKVVFFMFLPLLVLFVYTLVVCIKINLTVCKARKEKEDLDEFVSFRLAAREGNKEDLIKYLTTKVKTPLDIKNNTESFKSDDAMFQIDYKNPKGINVFHTVILAKQLKLVSRSHVECVEILLSHGVNVQDAFPWKSSKNSVHPYGLALFVSMVYKQNRIHKWYALKIMEILLAAGYKMESLEEHHLLTFLMENYCEGNSIETRFFVESLDFSAFRPHILRQVIEELHIVTDTDTEDLQVHVKQFLESVVTGLNKVQSLQVLTRKSIRTNILDNHPENNLYFVVVQLPLPRNVIEYLLYGQKPQGIGHFIGYSEESVV